MPRFPIAGPYRPPAGGGAGAAGPQPRPTPSGLPYQALPGFANAGQAALHQQRVGAGPGPQFQVDPYTAGLVGYFVQQMRDQLLDGLRNMQQHARPPSHIAPPFSAICVDRHVGTGGALTGDPPIGLPLVAPGGAFTSVLGFTTPPGNNGVFKFTGFDIDIGGERPNVEFRITVDGKPVPPFDGTYGNEAAIADGTWFGFPGTVADPMEICILTQQNQVLSVDMRNAFAAGAVNVAARLKGWVYAPTIQTDDHSIRGTLTDQR